MVRKRMHSDLIEIKFPDSWRAYLVWGATNPVDDRDHGLRGFSHRIQREENQNSHARSHAVFCGLRPRRVYCPNRNRVVGITSEESWRLVAQ